MTRPQTLLAGLCLLLTACAEPADDAAHHDHGPPGPSGERVRLTAAQAATAGVEVAAIGSGRVRERLRLTAVVHENLDAQAHLTPKVPGLVRSVNTRLGDAVAAGEVLCELESTVLGEASSSYMEARASLDAARDMLRRETALLDSSVHVAERIHARESQLKDEAITTLRPFYEAEKALAEARLSRDRRLLELEREVRQREIQLHTAEERLEILGLSQADLRQLAADEEHGHGRYPLRAPRSGVVVARDITTHEYVDTSSKLFLIQDLQTVWVLASVYERDLRRVARGQQASVRLEAFPGVELEGQVTFLSYEVDPTSRACQLRIELENDPIPGWDEPFPLRPGLFGRVELTVGERDVAVAVPESALVHEGERDYVFVAVVEPEQDDHDDHDDHADDHDDHDDAGGLRFVRRPVEVGLRGESLVEVTRGLEPGERIAVAGTFTLASAARQGELGGGHSH